MNRTLLYQSVRNGLQVRFPVQAMPSRHCIAQACAVDETPEVTPLLFAVVPTPMTPSPLFEFRDFAFDVSGGTPPYTLGFEVLTPGANIDVSVYNDPPSGNVRMQNSDPVDIRFTVEDSAGQTNSARVTFEAQGT